MMETGKTLSRYVCIYVYVCACVCIHVCVCVCMYVFVCVYIYTHTYISCINKGHTHVPTTYIYIHTHTHTHIHTQACCVSLNHVISLFSEHRDACSRPTLFLIDLSLGSGSFARKHKRLRPRHRGDCKVYNSMVIVCDRDDESASDKDDGSVIKIFTAKMMKVCVHVCVCMYMCVCVCVCVCVQFNGYCV